MNESVKLFMEEVLQGLKSSPKTLSSKYFYDDEGSRIFQQIMDMPEYYLPEAEFEIIQTQSEAIARRINQTRLDIIELGAGDGRKMVHLVQVMSQFSADLSYFPLDISEGILKVNEELFRKTVPSVHFESLAGDYFKTLPALKDRTNPRLIVFAGSNIGNFRKGKAVEFLKFIKGELKPGDFFALGVDLKKDPKKILSAYNDPTGLTKRFNLNLLTRINRELKADFDLKSFEHYATYHPITGAAESFLFSLRDQAVTIGDEVIQFQRDEVIQMEISQKYDLPLLQELSSAAGLSLDSVYSDSQGLFSWVLMV
ncbi:L-histidine N(alpha)-methyltransferase [Algoriphagus terrigena]|uniref:L-histidine N(alpha)-methyltransferase n=1 Tax=Algoriphagus terrigena TaxID=344884 RepID=UPI00041B5967|nr:L-histidine N(alpha)-methyltransferase [Algoriphagus terrigena]